MLAFKSFDAFVHFNVLVEVGLLCEAHAAFGALVRFLSCVNPKMVVEIMPFSEVFGSIAKASRVFTLKYFHLALRGRIFEGKYSILVVSG